MTEIQEKKLEALREKVSSLMSPKRFFHTLMVEKMVEKLALLYCPEEVFRLRAAALLHDTTKEKTPAEQVELCRKYGLAVTDENICAPKTFHARTAAASIPDDYPEWNDSVIVSAVLRHTTGHKNMTLTEKLLYLADYIDESRQFENCVALRNFFFDAEPERMDAEERKTHLAKTLLMSYDMTVRDLLADGLPIATDTVEARNELTVELIKKQQ